MSKEQFLKENLRLGEQYAGLLLGKGGKPDQHIFLLPWEANGVTWNAAVILAQKAGGELPTRREQSLLFANLKDQFKPEWYWSGEQHASTSDYAWIQTFGYGSQYDVRKSFYHRARAVRRLEIQ